MVALKKSAGAPGPSNSLQRVKVYRLSDDGKWDDQGTGHVTVDSLEGTDEVGLVVVDEEDSEALLMHRICSEDIYRKQEDTIISWRDPEYATDLALSFQESAGCTFIWDQMSAAQRNLQFSTPNDITSNNRTELKQLPAVELSTLPSLLKVVTESGNADQMRLIELVLKDQEFFRKLMDLFKISEDLDDNVALHMIYKIVKGIILLNSSQIFEKIFGDDLLMDLIGSLEYDPEVQSAQHHRDFLNEHVVFKEAIPIKDSVVLSKIHQTYRIGYLKDIILPKVLDEATLSSLNSIIHSNNAIVVSLLKDDNTFIQELFAKLKSATTSAESKRNLVFFLHEFCSLSKSLQVLQQIHLFRDLINEGIFDVVAIALQSEDKKLVLTGTNILILFLNQDPNLLRNYVIRQEGNLLLGLLVKGMVTDFGEDMNCQFLEIIRSLLDSYTLPATQRDTVVEIFYEKHLSHLVDIIISSCTSGGTKPEILSNICDLLCYCVLHHPYRIKCNFLLHNLIEGVLYLTRRREKYLVVSAVRFVRTILSRHDEHLIYHFVYKNILKPVVEAFVANGDRYNLLNSVVLDLFEYIRKENLQPLVRYIVESFWNQLVRFESLPCIRSFKIKYDQISEDIDTRNNSPMDSQNQLDDRALDKDEEKYFNGNSDNEETRSGSHSNKKQALISPGNGSIASHPSTSSKFVGLVDDDDDDDDDDDEDYQPPPKKHSKGIVESSKSKRKLPHMDKESELMKKKRLEDLKFEDTVAAPLYSTISQAEMANQETLDSAKTVTSNSSEASERSDDERHCREESISDESYFDNHKSVGCGNSDSELVKENSTCQENQFENYSSPINENPGAKEHYGVNPACQKSCSNNQSYVGSDEEHSLEDPSSLVSNQRCAEDTMDKELLNNRRCLDNKSSYIEIESTLGTEPNDPKDCLEDRNLAENHKQSEPSDDKKFGKEDYLAMPQRHSPELSTKGS